MISIAAWPTCPVCSQLDRSRPANVHTTHPHHFILMQETVIPIFTIQWETTRSVFRITVPQAGMGLRTGLYHLLHPTRSQGEERAFDTARTIVSFCEICLTVRPSVRSCTRLGFVLARPYASHTGISVLIQAVVSLSRDHICHYA